MFLYFIVLLVETLFVILLITVLYPNSLISNMQKYMDIYVYKGGDSNIKLVNFTYGKTKASFYHFQTANPSPDRCIIDVPGGSFVFCCNNFNMYRKLFQNNDVTYDVYSVLYPTIVDSGVNIESIVIVVRDFICYIISNYNYNRHTVIGTSAGVFLACNAIDRLESVEKIDSIITICGYFDSRYFNRSEIILRFMWWFYGTGYRTKTPPLEGLTLKKLVITAEMDFLKNNSLNFYRSNRDASFYNSPGNNHFFLWYAELSDPVFNMMRKFLKSLQ